MKVIDGLILLGAAGGAAIGHNQGGLAFGAWMFGGAMATPLVVAFVSECTSRR